MIAASILTITGTLALSWWIFHIQRSREALAEKNRQLSARARELEEQNHVLVEKMQERTKSLVTLQTQLFQSEKLSSIGHLAAGVAHEINNPIGFINCNLQTLEKYFVHYRQLLGILNKLEKALNDKDQQTVSLIITSWEKIRNEANFKFMDGDIGNLLKESIEGTQKVGRIIADLRALASPDRGQMDSINLEALMESILNIVFNEIKYKAQLRKEYGQVPMVICNPQKIGQVFINLLINAAQSIEGKGVITIKTYIKEEYICTDIMDTGRGIAPENITKVFDPFFTTKAPGEGTGMGLSLSYDIVRKHGGSLSFNSKLGEGTTFTVMLPLVAPLYDTAQSWRDYERD